ncbi:MAG: carboxypeptidase regulatory-like domain-containing protein [Planctomycetes bacterium]|nr:carboxypeptidase regulatory-like domain-containing protein [Planctomycetota bacterium]
MRRAGALVLLLALAVLIWVLLREGGEEGALSAPPEAEAPAASAGEPAEETAEQVRMAEETPSAKSPEVPWPSGGLCGSVTDEEGRPIAGAEVSLEHRDWTHPVERELSEILEARLRPREADGAGRFLFEELPASGDFHLWARARGHAPLEQAIVCRVAADRTMDIGAVVLAPESCIVGVVVDETGAPIEGAEIRLWGEGPDGPTATSGGDGRFLISGLGAKPSMVEAKKGGFVSSLPPFPFRVLGRGETWDNVRVVLQHGRMIRGVVLGEDRLPVAGARVRTAVAYYEFHPNGDSAGGQVDAGETKTDASGSFQVRAPASEHETLLVVEADGFDPWSRTLDPRAAEVEPITLTRKPPLRSVVLRPFDRLSGQAVTPARILVKFRDRQGQAQSAGFGGPEDWTERDGCCVVQAPLVGSEEKIEVRIAAPDYFEAGVANVPWSRDPISVPMTRGGVVAGRVLDKNGAPLEHAWVGLLPLSGQAQRDAQAWTNADGAFRFGGLEKGHYHASANRHDLAPVRKTVLDVAPEREVEGLNLVLAERTATIFGSVLGFAGEPVPRMRILAGRKDGERASGMSDATGAYRVAGVPPGVVHIRLVAPREDYEWAGHGVSKGTSAGAPPGITVVELRSGAEQRVDLDLRRSTLCAVEGTVRVNGAPAFDVEVCVYGSEDRGATHAYTDRSGRFFVPPFPAGPVLLRVSSRDDETLEQRELQLAAGRVHRFDLDVRTARLEVLVLDGRSGLPAWPSDVDAYRWNVGSTEMPEACFGDTVTGRDGVGTFATLPAGRYLIRADSPMGDGLASEAAIVDLGAGESRRVEICRQPFARLLVRIPSGTPDSVRRFELRRQDGWRVDLRGESRRGDTWQCPFLPPGRFLLVALGQDDKELAALDVDLRPGEETTVDLPAD